jgi:predicted PurR-regulated permease PerM
MPLCAAATCAAGPKNAAHALVTKPIERSVRIAPRSLLWVVLTVAACWVALKLLPVVMVVVVALFLVGTLDPAVDWFERHHIGRGWGVLCVFVGLLLVSAGFLLITLPALFDQVRSLIADEPKLRDQAASLLSHSHYTAQFADKLRHFKYDSLLKGAATWALAASADAVEFIGYLVSAVFLALYMMVDRDRLRGGLYAVVPREHHVRLARILLRSESIVGGYIRGQALTSLLMAVFVFVLLSICKVPNALALAVFAGLADVLPYVGAILSTAPAAAAATSQGTITVAIVVVAMLAYQEFESRVLVPRIYGHALRLPSSMVLLALLAGGTLMGIAGALLALPIAAALRMLIEELRVVLPGESVDNSELEARDAQAEEEYSERTAGVPAERAAAIAVEISQERFAEPRKDTG